MDKYYKDTKECPMCAETVKAKAKICRFCRHEFEFETEEINPPAMDSPELETPATTNEIFYDVWITNCPSACDRKVVEVLMTECSFETMEEALEVIYAIPTTLFVGLTKEEAEYYQKSLEEAGATVTIEKSDMKEHATTITQEFLDQLDGEEPNADDYYKFMSTENSPAEEAPVAEEEAEEEEAPVEEPILDDKGWTTFNEFKSTENPPATDSSATTKYDVWITSAYNDKICDAIIDITNWDAWVAGKFLLDLEDYGDAIKLVEDVDIDEAERIKNKLEEAGARVTLESHT
jgi:ribosomal protein L7/L12